MPLFSIIVATCNRSRDLVECLEAIASLEHPRFEFEVLVVDDGSEPPASEVAQTFSDRISIRNIRQPNAGPAAARNRGAREAVGRWIAYTDDDCRPRPNWLVEFRAGFERWGDCLLGGGIEVPEPKSAGAVASHVLSYHRYERYAREPETTRRLGSLNIAAPRDAFLELGGFDETFRTAAYEDYDLCDRWLASGRPIRFAERAVVVHDHRMTVAELWRQHTRFGRGARSYYRKQRMPLLKRLFSRDLLESYTEAFAGIRHHARGLDQLRVAALIAWAQLGAAVGCFSAHTPNAREALSKASVQSVRKSSAAAAGSRASGGSAG